MNYSDYVKDFETASKIPDNAFAYDITWGWEERAEILAEAFSIPKDSALQWVSIFPEMKFQKLLNQASTAISVGQRDAEKAIKNERKIRVEEKIAGMGSFTESMPVVYSYFSDMSPSLFLITQSFLHFLEKNGYYALVFFQGNANQAEALYAMQQYGWKVDRIERVSKYYGDGSNDLFKEATFIIRKDH